MDKLTINELKWYLGTGLKFQLTIDRTEDFCTEDWYSEDKFKKGAIWELIGIVQAKDLNIPLGEGYLDGFLFKNDLTYCNFNNGIKPLLYPLSSLTEYREDLGFVPIEKLKELYFETNIIKSGGTSLEEELVIKDGEFKNYFQDYYYTGDNIYTSYNPIGYNESVNIYNQLYSWHIDVHNLIDRNLAINIKTLKDGDRI
jgi:hypothetical protein